MQVVMTIAGSDSSGGAGIQADIKTFEYFGVFGTSVLTVLTAQNSRKVEAIFPLNAEFVRAQIDTVFEDLNVCAVKVGMLFNEEIILCVKESLERYCKNIPVILDPVAVSNAGDVLLEKSAIDALKTLFPFVTLITPNRRELKLLLQSETDIDEKYIYTKCFEIRKTLGVDVLAKNFVHEGMSSDYLITLEGLQKIEAPYIDSKNTHGSGCTLSSAITAQLALGESLPKAIELSKKYVSSAIKHAPNFGQEGGALRHNLH